MSFEQGSCLDSGFGASADFVRGSAGGGFGSCFDFYFGDGAIFGVDFGFGSGYDDN
jgi:hypothetical protein